MQEKAPSAIAEPLLPYMLPGTLDLWFQKHDYIFLAYHQSDVIGIKIRRSILLNSVDGPYASNLSSRQRFVFWRCLLLNITKCSMEYVLLMFVC